MSGWFRAYIRKQVVNNLIIQTAGKHGLDPIAVGIVLRGLNLQLSPVHLDYVVGIGQRPRHLFDYVVCLEEDVQVPGHDEVRYGKSAEDGS